MRTAIHGLVGVAGLAVALFAAASTPDTEEEPYPWCAVYGGGEGGTGATTCSFDTFEQCRATVGISGYCQPNPMYPGPEKKAVKQSRMSHQGWSRKLAGRI
jgi:Protein of unknown function (DUF3551)